MEFYTAKINNQDAKVVQARCLTQVSMHPIFEGFSVGKPRILKDSKASTSSLESSITIQCLDPVNSIEKCQYSFEID